MIKRLFGKLFKKNYLNSEDERAFSNEELVKKGWFQGSIFKVNCKKSELDCGYYIVLNQSCDLLHHCIISEPFAEVLKVFEVASDSKSLTTFMYGKSTRALTFKCDKGKFWKASSLVHREKIDRRKLTEYTPICKVEDLRNFACWLGRRYDRIAFPDNFNVKFSNAPKNKTERKAYRQFVKLVKKYDIEISEVWIQLDSWKEEDNYTISIVIILSEDGYTKKDEIKRNVEDLLEGDSSAKQSDGVVKIKGMRNCFSCINIEDIFVLEKHEFSRADIEEYSLMNLDDISHSSGAELPRVR